MPWSGGKQEVIALPEIGNFTQDMEPKKSADFTDRIAEGDISGAVNRVVDPPGDSSLCLPREVPVPKRRPEPLEREATVSDTSISTSSPATGVCRHYKKWVDQGVPKEALQQMLSYYSENQTSFKNQRYLSIADYSKPSGQKRFYLLDTRTGNVTKDYVSHGSGSVGGVASGDPDHDGMINRCSHSDGKRTNMTRVGFFRTSNFYFSTKHDRRKKGRKGWPNLSVDSGSTVNGMRLVGLSSTNAEALGSGVVMHEAYYNQDAMAARNQKMGRSWGCPAFLPGRGAPIMNKISNGSLFYGYTGNKCQREMKRGPLAQVPGWQRMCE